MNETNDAQGVSRETLVDLDIVEKLGVLPILLEDRTRPRKGKEAKRNIVWGTDSYAALGEKYQADAPIERETLDDEVEINFAALARYMREARAFLAGSGSEFSGAPLGSVVEYLRLPGVIGDKRSSERESLPDRLWDAIARNVDEALENLQAMRRAEGESTRSYLASILDELRERIAGVKELAPTMVESYRERVSERVAKALAEVGAELNPGDVAREIAIYTDRVDISEEIARFESHVAQFDAAMKNESSVGKKLDFLTQEMFRETNTIGSKASSPEILQRVVEMKSAIERAREMVQNVE